MSRASETLGIARLRVKVEPLAMCVGLREVMNEQGDSWAIGYVRRLKERIDASCRRLRRFF